MSKAEEEANKRYSITRGDDTEETSGIDMQRASDFIEGYKQAEKDLELGWEDAYEELNIEEPVSEDLENAAKNYCEGSNFSDACMEKPAFKAGANWQKEQIMKKAFPVEIGRQRSDYKCVHHGNFANYDTGDKVKVIIIKEK